MTSHDNGSALKRRQVAAAVLQEGISVDNRDTALTYCELNVRLGRLSQPGAAEAAHVKTDR